MTKLLKISAKFGQKTNEVENMVHFLALSKCGMVLARFIWNAEISVSIAIHCY